jgi:hypothetical protein
MRRERECGKYDAVMATRRPNPALWLHYQFVGKLPDEYREWVLHDATCSTWMLRVFVRGLVQVTPIAAIMLVGLGVYGGSWPSAMGAVLLGVLVVGRIVLTSAVDSVDARLMRHGFPPGHGSAIRIRMDEAAAERYRAVWRREE